MDIFISLVTTLLNQTKLLGAPYIVIFITASMIRTIIIFEFLVFITQRSISILAEMHLKTNLRLDQNF